MRLLNSKYILFNAIFWLGAICALECAVREGYAFFIKNAHLLNWDKNMGKLFVKLGMVVKEIEQLI